MVSNTTGQLKALTWERNSPVCLPLEQQTSNYDHQWL